MPQEPGRREASSLSDLTSMQLWNSSSDSSKLGFLPPGRHTREPSLLKLVPKSGQGTWSQMAAKKLVSEARLVPSMETKSFSSLPETIRQVGEGTPVLRMTEPSSGRAACLVGSPRTNHFLPKNSTTVRTEPVSRLRASELGSFGSH